MGVAYQNIDLTLAADATQDIWSLLAPAGHQLTLLGWELTSDEIAAEKLELDLHFISAVGSGGALTGTEELAAQGSGETIRGTVRTEDTTPGASNGSIKSFSWEQLGPVGLIYIPEMRPSWPVSTGIALGCTTAEAAVLNGYICWGWGDF